MYACLDLTGYQKSQTFHETNTKSDTLNQANKHNMTHLNDISTMPVCQPQFDGLVIVYSTVTPTMHIKLKLFLNTIYCLIDHLTFPSICYKIDLYSIHQFTITIP